MRQIRQESALRDAIEAALDDPARDGRGRDPDDVRGEVRELVEHDPELAWALEPAERPTLAARARDKVHLVAVPLLSLPFLPILLLVAPFWAVLLRVHEKRDAAPDVRPDEERVQMLAALEDHVVQNPFTAIGQVKPGRFRLWTLIVILFYLNYATRHFFSRGDLAGVKTIHFARWVFIDGKRRVFFASNYDGSLESYMDDFIDKVAWGLNLVFSNGVGYPRTSWLVRGGARDELAFKDYLRMHQVPTRVWYLGLRPADRAEHPAERAHPRRPARRRRRRGGCSRCDARARRHPGPVRPRLRRPEGGRVPAARDRGRGRRPALAGRTRPARSRAPRRGRTSARSTSRSPSSGLAQLGLPARALAMFSNEFVAGMTTAHRSRMLGDLGENAPARWEWGGPSGPPIDIALLLYARDDAGLQRLEAEQARGLAAGGLALRHRLGTSDLDDSSPSASATGSRSRSSRGSRRRARPRRPSAPASSSSATRTSTASTRTARCSLPPPTRCDAAARRRGLRSRRPRPQRQLPRPPPAGAGRARVLALPRRRDAAPDGSSDPQARLRLASKMVGRWPSGAPLALAPDADDPSLAERERLRLPRARPARSPLPGRLAHPARQPARLARSRPGSSDSWAINRRHRILRRGREYGTSLTIEEALAGGDTTERGLNFICLNANIQRQFEFIHHTWLNNPKFAGLYDDADPVAAPSAPFGGTFTIPTDGVRERVTNVPRFVSVKGGAYFFLPGLAAVRYLAGMGERAGELLVARRLVVLDAVHLLP